MRPIDVIVNVIITYCFIQLTFLVLVSVFVVDENVISISIDIGTGVS